MVKADRLQTFLPIFGVGIANRKTELWPARNPLTNSSSPLTEVTQNVTTKTELGRQLAFAGIHLICQIYTPTPPIICELWTLLF